MRVVQSDEPTGAASEELVAALNSILTEREHVRVAVAGGSALAALAPALEALGAARARIRLTWVDERCVPVADAESNRGTAVARWADRGPGETLPLWLDGETVDAALTRVRAGLATRFEDGLDVTLLGMGGDGHIASLFVGRRVDADRVAHVPDSPKPPARRMTLTRDLLATATTHVLLAKGEGKRDALTRLLAGDSTLPATGLPGLVLVTDLDLEMTT